MRYFVPALFGVLTLALVHCQDGSSSLKRPDNGLAGMAGTAPTSGGAGSAGDTGHPGGAGVGNVEMGAAGTTAIAGTSGIAGSASMGSAGTGAAGSTATAGASGGAGNGGSVLPGTGGIGGAGGTITTDGGLRRGPFKIIVLTTPLTYYHPSTADCAQMLIDLGKATAPERTKIVGLAADAVWTVDQIASEPSKPNYFSEVSPDNLKNYELFYSNNPTGAVFTNAPNAAQKKQTFVDYWNDGGSWAGQHSATDFEKNGSWSWYQDNIDGAWFSDHDAPTTTGTVTWQPEYVNHPILKGLTSPWSAVDEWYVVNRNVEAVKGFRVLAKVTVSNSSLGTTPRPAVWITENANGKGGRAFYTIRGHNPSVYAEPEFRELMLRGILWSVHRLPGGN